MRELIAYIAESIVDHPEEVQVSEQRYGDRTVLHLRVAEADMGKVIGKQGRIAEAMRTLLKVAAAKSERRVSLEIGQ